MNRKGNVFDLIKSNVVYLVLFILVFSTTAWFVMGIEDGGALLEDSYAREVARVINHVEPGTQACLDVSELSVVAINNGLNVNEIFRFDNEKNEILVKTKPGRGTSYNWFNEVDVVDSQLRLVSGGETVNRICFFVEGQGDKLA